MDMFQRLTRHPVLRAAVGTRRAIRGPKRPSWTVEMEIAAELLRLYCPVLKRLSPERQRRGAERLMAPNALCLETPRERVDAGGVPATWFRPRAHAHGATIYYLHGGGYVLGSMRTHGNLIVELCDAAGASALGLEYRLAPEHPFPAAIEDGVAGYRYLLAQGVRPDDIVFAGDSAGAGLALATLCQARELGLPLPAAAVLLSPWADLACDSKTFELHYPYDYVFRPYLKQCAESWLAGQDPKHPLASPVHGDFRGLPPLLIQVGGAETLLDDAVRVAARARQAGVDVRLDVHRDMNHVFQLLASFLPEAGRALREAGAFVREATSKDARKLVQTPLP